MIGFENIKYLQAGWLLLVLVLAYAGHAYFQAKTRRQFGEPAQVKKLVQGRIRSLNFIRFSLFLAALGALIVALANPQLMAEETKAVEAGAGEIIFAIDVSNSMLSPDVLPDRLTRARSFLTEATRALSGTQIGLVAFAGKAYPYLPLTGDHSVTASAIKTLNPNLASVQGSSLREALKISALLLLQQSGKVKTICVVSDGESHQQNFGSLADSLRRRGINVFAVGIGTPAGDLIPVKDQAGLLTIKKDRNGEPVISRLNENNLRQLAGKNKANYIRFETNETAVAALTSGLKKQSRLVKTGKKVKASYYPHFLMVGFLLLIAEMLIPAGRKLRF